MREKIDRSELEKAVKYYMDGVCMNWHLEKLIHLAEQYLEGKIIELPKGGIIMVDKSAVDFVKAAMKNGYKEVPKDVGAGKCDTVKVKLISHNSPEQLRWNSFEDTKKSLRVGEMYDARIEEHSWHTKIWINGKAFNSVCFEVFQTGTQATGGIDIVEASFLSERKIVLTISDEESRPIHEIARVILARMKGGG